MTVSEKMIQCLEVTDWSWYDLSQGGCDKEEEGGPAHPSCSPTTGWTHLSTEAQRKGAPCVSMVISSCTQVPAMFRKL